MENAAAERVLITSPSQDRVYAARQGQPTTYEVEKSAVEEIQRSIGELQKVEEAAGESDSPATKNE
jgi:hypothetical protein